MRIVTRPDFDGVVCAALLYEAEKITKPVKWAQPNDMQSGLVDVQKGDIIANLPYDERCALWFDHHYTNRVHKPFKGMFKLAPSAASIIYEYYKDKFRRDYSELIKKTDKIDSADLSVDEVLHPEKHPYLLLSMTIFGHAETDESYWNRLVELLRKFPIDKVLDDPDVKERCRTVVEQNKQYQGYLKKHTRLMQHVCVTDFRSLDNVPEGNRFLVYALFPEAVVSAKIRFEDEGREKVAVSVGHNIFNRNCNVNVGLMLSKFEGGGHREAGSCRFHVSKANAYIPEIIEILLENEVS
ncbi:MAG: exopolyphosphatase, partial [Proteobacteria bacterium]|nr:exopolyphosphatase [Pseudomonadota bacterium]